MKENLNFEALKRNIVDIIQESQIKLGYTETPIGLYYPIESLNRLLDAELSVDGMEAALTAFEALAGDPLGAVTHSRDHTRFCIHIPAEGVRYVHEKVEDNGFLRELIDRISSGPCTIDDVREVFSHYSDRVKCEKIPHEEFDYLVYFEDGVPDGFYYCIKLECAHASYHRFTPKDYAAFGIEAGS